MKHKIKGLFAAALSHLSRFPVLLFCVFLISLLPLCSLSAPHPYHPSWSKLQFAKLPAEVPVMFRVVELPMKHYICKVKSLNKGDANSEVTVYYQVHFQLDVMNVVSRFPPFFLFICVI